MAEQAARTVAYADRFELEQEIVRSRLPVKMRKSGRRGDWKKREQERASLRKHMKRSIENVNGGMIPLQDRRLGQTRGG
nr:hypothetical protein [Clostridium sp. AM51-4]